MKNWKDIERMSFEELERIAGDSSVQMPERLMESIEAGIAGAELAGKRESKVSLKWLPAMGTLAALAAIAVAVVFTNLHRPTLTDTYDDPLLAYAEIEKRFNKISEKINKTADFAEESYRHTEEMTNRIINQITEK